MFDLDNDMFKPIIGARLIRDEAEKQAALKQPGEVPVEGAVNPLPGKEIKTLPQGQEIQNTSLKGGSKERA